MKKDYGHRNSRETSEKEHFFQHFIAKRQSQKQRYRQREQYQTILQYTYISMYIAHLTF